MRNNPSGLFPLKLALWPLMANCVLGQVELRPTASFDLSSVGSISLGTSNIRAVAASNDEIFLVRAFTQSTGASAELVRMNNLGSVVAVTPISLRGDLLEVNVSKSGYVAASTRLRDGSVQVELGGMAVPGPQVMSLNQSLLPPCRAISIVDRRVFFLGPNNRIVNSSSGIASALKGSRVANTVPVKCLLVSVDDSTVAILDKFSNVVRFIDTQTGIESILTVQAPEVVEAMKKIESILSSAPDKAKAVSPMLFFDAASDGEGNLYIAVGPSLVERGMQVVHIGPNRQYAGSLRLVPNSSLLSGSRADTKEVVLQRRLAVHGSTFITVSSLGRVHLFRRQGGGQQ